VKTRLIILVSVGLNLGLTTTLVALRSRSPVATAPMAAEETAAHVVTNELVSASAADSQAAPPAAVFHWRMIESKDVRQYVANLRLCMANC